MKRLILTLCAALVLVFGLSVLASAQSRPRGGGGGGGGGQAAPRSGGQSHASPPSAPAPASQRGGSQGGSSVRPRGAGATAPASNRPPGGGRFYGTATPRTSGFYGRVYLPNHYYVSPYYYSPYAFGAFGFGFWGYDPFWCGGWLGGYPYWGWGNPYWGYGYPGYGYGYNYGYYDYDRGEAAYQGEAGYQGEQRGTGSLKLKVKPKEAEVYVDGYYMGQVDDFDGSYQHLDLESGTHKIEIRAEGYQPLVIDMRIEPGRTVTYQSEMRRIQ